MTQPVLLPIMMLSIVDDAAIRVATFVVCIVVIISVVAAVVSTADLSTVIGIVQTAHSNCLTADLKGINMHMAVQKLFMMKPVLTFHKILASRRVLRGRRQTKADRTVLPEPQTWTISELNASTWLVLLRQSGHNFACRSMLYTNLC